LAPDSASLLSAAVDLHNRGDLDGAQALYWKILAGDPIHFNALHLLGVSKCQQGRHAEGSWFIGRALEQRPDEPGARYNLGLALLDMHRPAAAIVEFDRTLAARPDHALAWVSRGDAMQTDGRFEDAVHSYKRAVAVRPGLAVALGNICKALLALGRPAEALEILEDALSKGADRGAALLGIGRAQQALGRLAEARASFGAACAADPDAAEPRWAWAIAALPDLQGDASDVAASRQTFADAIDALSDWYDADPDGRRDRTALAWPFYLAYQARNNVALLQRFGALLDRCMDRWRAVEKLPPMTPARDGPIRVGIVSAQLHSHSVWHAIVRGWFAHFDPSRIALHGFHLGSQSDSETTWAASRAAGFTAGRRPLRDWVAAIQAFRPEVLIYPAIGMDNLSANLAALRLAPVQMASWGHPETTGIPNIDCYISAEAFEPPDAEAAYSEELIRLPGLGVAYRPPSIVPRAPDFGALGIDPSRPIVLCPGTPFKYPADQDAVPIALVRRVPTAQLVFFHAKNNMPLSSRLEQRLIAAFATEGLDFSAHAKFVPFQNMESFYGLLRRADVCLDTMGFSGFNLAMHALENGVPFVAYEGAFMRGRLGSGILRLMGLDEMVATGDADFVSIAARSIEDSEYNEAIRSRIASAVAGSYDDRRAVGVLQEEIIRRARPWRK